MKADFETNGTIKRGHNIYNVYCPTEDMDCPYYNPLTGTCHIAKPAEDCDDFSSYYETMNEYIDNLIDG